MSERELSRRSFTRFGAAALALPALGTLQGLAAPQAYANTSNLWTDFDWRLAGYENGHNGMFGRQYFSLVRALRDLVSQPMAGAQNDPDFFDTTRFAHESSRRVIRILLWNTDNRANVALYFNVDNLYLMGFTAHGRHYRFDEARFAHLSASIGNRFNQGAPLVTVMNSNGNYGELNASAEWRGGQQYTTFNFLYHLHVLEGANQDNVDSVAVHRALAFFIGATSEAARFAWIEERIANVLMNGEDVRDPARPRHLGTFGTGLQNAWDPLSVLAHQTMEGRLSRAVNIDGREYRDFRDIANGHNRGAFAPRIAPFIAILGKGL
jgi:hypothetical protein